MTGLLFIDDEEGVRRSLKRALKNEPYAVLTAEDGTAAIKLVEDHVSEIAIVISDYKMPGLDGLETLRIIASINPEITRILLTGYATMRSAIEATNDGLDGFLTKPFDNVELRNRIQEIMVKKRLRQFVSHQVYEKIRTDPSVMAPRRTQATVLFSDIRGFTRMSQRVPPEEIAHFLNESYFTPLGEIAYRHDGTVDKHMGDCMMVVFGAPVSRKDDVVRALESAVDMQKTSQRIARDLRGGGFDLPIGIGICTGEVVTGVFGSLRRREYTAFGLAVNIASRLEKMARGGEVLISETTYQGATDRFPAQQVGAKIPVRGLDEPVAVYRLVI